MFDVIVIGAGVVGSLIARKLSSYVLDVLVIEKENDVGNATSMANSAIIHSGYDPIPNSLKAKLNVKGNKMFPKMCEELDVDYEINGSLTVALYDEQLPMLDELAKRAKENGVEVRLLNKEELLELEPNLNKDVKGALYAPTAGIVNCFTLPVHAMENACDNGVKLHLDEEVVNIIKKGDYFIVKTNRNEYETKIIINAAGIYADKIHSLVEPIDYKITPRKGEYFVLDHYGDNLVKHTIFPLPSEKGKGILVAKTTSNNFIVGPSSEPIDSKDDLSTDKLTLDIIKKQAQLLVPNIPFNQVIRTFSGLRATPSTHDFIIKTANISPNFIVLSGIESPGYVSSIAIAEMVVEEYVRNVITLKKNDDYNPYVRKRIRPKKFTNYERDELIKQNPDYGIIICNCEKVSLGEIKDELSRSVAPKTIKAMKKRTRAGFGKCQSGFCQALVLQEIAKHFDLAMTKVLYDKDNSYIVRYNTKGEKDD